jgi:hypothetical protein
MPTQPSPAINPQIPLQQMPRRRTRTLSTSSNALRNLQSPVDVAPAMCTCSRTHSTTSASSTPAKTCIILPQVTFQSLPVLQEGEGLKVDKSEIDTNEGITVNFVDGDSSWTLVQRCKKNKVKKDNKSEKWNPQQKKNFKRFGDIYQGVPYKSYRNVDIGPPVANIPLQQQVVQPPPVQQPIAPPAPFAAPPAQPPIIPPAPVAIAAAAPLPIPLIVITPLPRPITPGGQNCPRL